MGTKLEGTGLAGVHKGRFGWLGNVSSDRKKKQKNKGKRVMASDTFRNAMLVVVATLLAYALTYPAL
jgi:hypothetical protein